MKISIVTVTLNADRFLEQTIASIAGQSYRDKEYIVVDGGSTDRTLDILNANSLFIDHWVSEPDNGIADAMNKGARLATGDYLLFIHADDYLVNENSLTGISRLIDPVKDINIFQVYLLGEERRISNNRKLGWQTMFKMGSCHQGHVCKKETFEMIGGFDISYRIAMDYDFMLRAYRAGVSSASINFPVSVMRQTGISGQRGWSGALPRLLEERSVHLKNCHSFPMKCLYRFYWSLYLPYRRLYSSYDK